MQDLSVLTPPLLMCAAVLFAIGAFLRHEMSKKRPEVDEPEPSEVTDATAGPVAPSEAMPPSPADAMAPTAEEAIAGPAAEAAQSPSAEEETGNYTTRHGRA